MSAVLRKDTPIACSPSLSFTRTGGAAVVYGSISCDAGVACRPGSCQASAHSQAYSTSGYGDHASQTTPVHAVTC
ncbi:hypothetical protein OHB01_27005 [Microbispora hainanensis]|jgi:hypothetical protein|uniref:Uncharacterized protein n=1 Tax=Microbispora hainanensis TaxID=568844 RepID=A0ABZ1SXD9_9ACTN|nr:MULTISPECIES: hypothetical protein [Microbispora]NJP25937.1 hypothetical protein [Microbispora sp. CL1-1]TQS13053.1 hypothetical protein FLW53_17370 [Microbispora sp. SCL1-1]